MQQQRQTAVVRAPRRGLENTRLRHRRLERNWNSYGADVPLDGALPAHWQPLLTDPQTSGGLLVACAPESAAGVLDTFRESGFAQAAVIGSVQRDDPVVEVRAGGG